MHRSILSALTWLSLSVPAPAQPAAFSEPPMVSSMRSSAGTDMAELIRRFDTDRAGVSRFYDMPWSELRMDRMERLLADTGASLAGVNFDALDREGQVDYLLLHAYLDNETAHLALSRAQLGEMEPLLPFRRDVQSLLASMWRMEDPDPESSAGRIAAIPDTIKKLRERLEKGRKDEAPAADAPESDRPVKVNRVTARRAAGAVSSIRWQLQQWNDFYAGYRPDFSWWVRKPFEQAVSSLDDYAKYLREELAGQKGNDDDPLVGDPIGAEALAADMRAEFLPYSPQDLIALGEREAAWCEAELKKASADMGLGDDWKAALAKVKANHVPPGHQDQLAEQLSKEAIAFVKERNLVNVPPLCEETWRLRMIGPSLQKTLPYAVYFGQAMGISYPTDDMKHDEKLMSMRSNNRHFLRIVSPHELIPGHHLQGYYEQRVRPYRQLFSTPFLVEGWALYWEMTLWDLSFARSPEDRIGMLFWRLHRCARITVSLKFHLGEMTPAQMVDYLVEHVGHERSAATSEVRRYIGGDYSPLYQCGYMIGGMQIRALRRELVDSGRMPERAFHDAILEQGPIPIEMIRAALTDVPLTRDHAPTWKFAGEVGN